MGQGAESCGGYEVDYNPYEEGLESGLWTTKTGSAVSVSSMTLSHLKGAKKIAERAALTASFSCDSDMWQEWVSLFEDEIYRRGLIKPKVPVKDVVTKNVKLVVRGAKVDMICYCGVEYQAREADLKRGWAFSCSKSCAAIRRDFGRPKATKRR